MADPAPPSTVCRHISGLSLNEARRKAPLIRRPLVNVTIGDLELGTNVQPYNSVQIKNTLEFEVLDRRGSREGEQFSLLEHPPTPRGFGRISLLKAIGAMPFWRVFFAWSLPPNRTKPHFMIWYFGVVMNQEGWQSVPNHKREGWGIVVNRDQDSSKFVPRLTKLS